MTARRGSSNNSPTSGYDCMSGLVSGTTVESRIVPSSFVIVLTFQLRYCSTCFLLGTHFWYTMDCICWNVALQCLSFFPPPNWSVSSVRKSEDRTGSACGSAVDREPATWFRTEVRPRNAPRCCRTVLQREVQARGTLSGTVWFSQRCLATSVHLIV